MRSSSMTMPRSRLEILAQRRRPPATLVVNTGASGGGHTGAGFNTIEFNNNTTLVIESNAQVIQNGSTTRTEAVNPLGTNNTIINRGLIQNGQGPAIWFQDTTVSAAQFNTIDNFGTIRTTLRNPDGSLTSVIGATANGTGGAVHFINESSGLVDGNIQFVGGDDQMTLFTGSTITGSIDGGGGTNTMILTGDGTDQLPGTISNFSFLTKTGNSTWTLLGNLVNTGGPLAVDVNQGTLILAANNPNFNGTMMVDAAGILQLGNGGTSGNINANITNNGTVATVQIFSHSPRSSAARAGCSRSAPARPC